VIGLGKKRLSPSMLRKGLVYQSSERTVVVTQSRQNRFRLKKRTTYYIVNYEMSTELERCAFVVGSKLEIGLDLIQTRRSEFFFETRFYVQPLGP
jgi:hypothetical protein